MTPNRIAILCGRSTADSPLYRSWSDSVERPVTFVEDYGAQWTPPDDTALVVTHRHYTAPETTLLPRLVRQQVPVLILADGILEYRNKWENPSVAPAYIFEPVLGHKLAAIGTSQARQVASWGNPGICEVVGLPRLDRLSRRPAEAPGPSAALHILVCTARTPAFTEDQRQLVKRGLQDLRDWFREHPRIAGRSYTVEWRLTGDLHKELDVPSRVDDISGAGMANALARASVLVTTPSTTLLEGMYCGLPCALLDYTNSPSWVPAAWCITAGTHMDAVMSELVQPPVQKCRYQDYVLHDALQCDTPATPRLLKLIDAMLETASACRREGRQLLFPPNMLSQETFVARTAEAPAVPAAKETHQQVVRERNSLAELVDEQQRKIAALENELRSLRPESVTALFAKIVRDKYRRFRSSEHQ